MRRPPLPVAAVAAALALALAAALPGRPAGAQAGGAAPGREPMRVEQPLGRTRSNPQPEPERTGGAPAAPADPAPAPADGTGDADGAGDGALAALRAEMIDAASGIMAEQETLLDLQRALTALAADEAARRGALEAERGRLARLLGGLQRLARVPPEALAARPGAPLDTVRSALLLRAAVPALEARAAALRRDLTDLAALRRDLMVRRARAEAVRARLNADIAGLSALADRRAQLLALPPAEPERTAAEAQALAGGAGTLHELLQRVAPDGAEQARDTAAAALAAPPAARTAAGRSTALRTDAEAAAVEPQLALLPPPAAPAVVNGVMLPAGGTVILGYGEPDMFGAASRGLVLQVYPGAPVVAPLDGLVRFAGPFRGYGDILILEHRGGYHTLVAGFGRIDVRVGQEVLGGEPVGVTPSPQTGAREAPTLYFEFRRNGQPIDPLLGLAAAQGRG